MRVRQGSGRLEKDGQSWEDEERLEKRRQRSRPGRSSPAVEQRGVGGGRYSTPNGQGAEVQVGWAGPACQAIL